MNEFVKIIMGTPIYVWFILIYLLFLGIKSLKTRIVYLPKLFIIPLILLAIKYNTLLSDGALVIYLVTMIGSIASFFIHSGNKIKVIKNALSVEVPGNYTTLIMLISFFIFKYCFGYLNSTSPDLALKYNIIENIISGLFSGYFIGAAFRYTYQYFQASK